MKKLISILTAFLAVSCQPHSEQATENASTSTVEDNKYLETINSGSTEWAFYFEESDRKDVEKLFQTAHKLVVTKTHTKANFKDSSKHLRSWVVLHYPEANPNEMVMDGDFNARNTFIVDVLNNKVIDQNDWDAVRPLLDLVASEIAKSPASLEENTEVLVSLTTLVAFGHERYIKNDGANSTGPVWKDQTLTYEVPPSGSSVVGKSCKLVLEPNKIEFTSENKVFN